MMRSSSFALGVLVWSVTLDHPALISAQEPAPVESSWGLSVFGTGHTGDIRRWVGGIDQGGAIQCRIGDRGGNCSSPANCIFNLSARAEHIRNSFCMHERMERSYLGKYVDEKAKGVYTCSCCNSTLFHSGDKFNSGRGHLSFWSQSKLSNVGYKHHRGSWWQHPHDTGLHCENCGAHLGSAPLPRPCGSASHNR